MTGTILQAQAFVPGHITGIFRIFDDCADLLRCGSRGGGFSVAVGTRTTVVLEPEVPSKIVVRYNGEDVDAPVTTTVVREMLKAYNVEARIRVDHDSDLPIGVGFGASGAGALGTALALGSLLDSDIDIVAAGQYAHRAEVVNHTGLGDVIAQTVGGVEVRTEPGAPGVGKVTRVSYPEDLRVVLAGAEGLYTRDVLTNPESRQRINDVGDTLLRSLLRQPTFEALIDVSKEFALSTGLMTERVRSALEELWDIGLDASSMVMLGDSVFCVCDPSETEVAERVLSEHWDSSLIAVTSIATNGGGLIGP